MNLRFRQSGGFAGLERGCEMPADALAPGLRKLLERALATPAENPVPPPGAADMTRYSLTVDTPGAGRELHFDDMTLPAALAPLFAHLTTVSKPLPLK
jgi:hypothetical protein